MLADADMGLAIVDSFTAGFVKDLDFVAHPFEPAMQIPACLLSRTGTTPSRIAEAFLGELEVAGPRARRPGLHPDGVRRCVDSGLVTSPSHQQRVGRAHARLDPGTSDPQRIVLVNPNTDRSTTLRMTRTARRSAVPGVRFEGHTMVHGPRVVADPEALRASATRVLDAGTVLAAGGAAGLLVAGFGDPGLSELRARVALPVTGIAEAGMAEAARDGRSFSIVTTTPALVESIRALAAVYGVIDRLVSIRVTEGDTAATMASTKTLLSALLETGERCVAHDRPDAVLIGGGPLAVVADTLAVRLPVPVVDPVAAGAGLAVARMRTR